MHSHDEEIDNDDELPDVLLQHNGVTIEHNSDYQDDEHGYIDPESSLATIERELNEKLAQREKRMQEIQQKRKILP